MAIAIPKYSTNKLIEQQNHASKVATSYLALTSAQYLVNKDLLGINVLLTRMQKDGMFDFASIYDAKNQLVAQVGARQQNAAIFSQEITFQDSTAGYIQVGFHSTIRENLHNNLLVGILSFHLILILLLTGILWFAADFLGMWVRGQIKPRKSVTTEVPLEPTIEPEPDYFHAAILVLKITPSRLAPTYRELMLDAVALYGGKQVSPEQDDLLVQFRQEEAAFSAVCAGLLIQSLINQIGSPTKMKLGIHWADPLADEIEEKATKHTSYLASIGEQSVLVSKAFAQILSSLNNVSYDHYHSSLAPDGEVFSITAVKNQALIERQALQLLENR